MIERGEAVSATNAMSEIAGFMQEVGVCDEVSLKPLSGGCHNEVYLCENGPATLPPKLIVRTPTCPEAVRAIEAGAAYLGDAPAPQVFAVDVLALSGCAIALEEYVDGVHKDMDELTTPEINELAKGIAHIHESTTNCFSNTSGTAPICSGTYADYLQAMLNESVIYKLPTIDMRSYAEASQLIAAGIRQLYTLVDTQPELFAGNQFSRLHHDLNPGNMLWRADGTVSFIDWNVTFGDPADDVDYVITNNRTNPRFKSEFLDAYRMVTGRDDVIARVGAYTLKNQLDDLVWIVGMHQRCPDDLRYDGEAYDQRLVALQTTLGKL